MNASSLELMHVSHSQILAVKINATRSKFVIRENQFRAAPLDNWVSRCLLCTTFIINPLQVSASYGPFICFWIPELTYFLHTLFVLFACQRMQ